MLGSAIRSSNGPPSTDFLTAVYVGWSSMAITGSSTYTPQTPGFQLFYRYVFLVGTSVISLTMNTYTHVADDIRRRTARRLDELLDTVQSAHHQRAEVHEA